MFSLRWELNNENTWTQGGEHHTPGSVGEWEEQQAEWGGITWGEMPDVGDGGMEAAHIAMCVPIQQSCLICTGTPEPKVQ